MIKTEYMYDDSGALIGMKRTYTPDKTKRVRKSIFLDFKLCHSKLLEEEKLWK